MFNRKLALLAAAFAAALRINIQGFDHDATVMPETPRKRGQPGKRKGRRFLVGNRYAPNGARECARRRRQIEAGSLKRENGYVG